MRSHPGARFALAADAAELAAALADPDMRAIALNATDTPLLADCFLDVAANVVSMREMTPVAVAGYFDALRRGP